MMGPLCPYASSGSEPLFLKNTFIHVETPMPTSCRCRARSEPAMHQNRSLASVDYLAGSHVGAEKESKTLPIMTNMEDHTTDAGSVTPRSSWSMSCPGTPSFPPQDAPLAIQETSEASFISHPHTFQPHTIVRVEGTSRDECCIRWTAEAKKVRGSDTSAVSPLFYLSDALLGAPLPFKIVLTPKVGCGSFKKAQGQGRMELKCLAPPNGRSIPTMTFRLSAGGGRGAEALQHSTGLVTHNFAQTGLAKNLEICNFAGLFDETSQTFVVCLNVLSPWH